ncbi:hypothetical protein EYF80_041859 [Liparis tanakae]|uniref:Uncharacterized protein n=1 Tax=Liparis tanakae TaxID=230148 RepID=A0A4Z2G2X3_9TELE|nr:hypothetical protein EYF80_041859 [Liparis tanakae]
MNQGTTPPTMPQNRVTTDMATTKPSSTMVPITRREETHRSKLYTTSAPNARQEPPRHVTSSPRGGTRDLALRSRIFLRSLSSFSLVMTTWGKKTVRKRHSGSSTSINIINTDRHTHGASEQELQV